MYFTSRGFFKTASLNGASMMKLPLSVTTGPAFARAMRRVAFGESSFVRRLRRREVCANGETSMGTPGVYLGTGEQPLHGCRGLKTHAGAQDDRVLPVVSDDDEPVGDSQRIPQGKTNGQTNVLAASASTFSRNWQAPPPLMQFNSASTLQASRLVSANTIAI